MHICQSFLGKNVLNELATAECKILQTCQALSNVIYLSHEINFFP